MVKKLISKAISKRILKSLQYPSGLFAASKKNVKTGYNKAWIRDNVFESLGLIAVKDYKSLKINILGMEEIEKIVPPMFTMIACVKI